MNHQFDAASEPPARDSASGAGDHPNVRRKFLGIQFACCGTYARVYINRNGTAYEGNCPKCAKRVRLKIGPGGTDARFFTAY